MLNSNVVNFCLFGPILLEFNESVIKGLSYTRDCELGMLAGLKFRKCFKMLKLLSCYLILESVNLKKNCRI